MADLRPALGWAFGGNGSVALGIRLTVAAIPMWENFSLIDESISHLSCALNEGRRTGFDAAGAEVRLQTALASALMYAGGLAHDADAAWDLALALAEQSGAAECQLRALWGRAVYDVHKGRPRPGPPGGSTNSPSSAARLAISPLHRTVNACCRPRRCIWATCAERRRAPNAFRISISSPAGGFGTRDIISTVPPR